MCVSGCIIFQKHGAKIGFRKIPRIHSDCEREGEEERESGPSAVAGI